MDLLIQATIIGLVQGLTEFLPISSSGHLLLLPYLFGWDAPFLESLAFTVVLHMATLAALLIYFWRDWLRLVPAGLAALRDRSLGGDPDRRLAWLILVSTIPAAAAGYLLNDAIESQFRRPALVALTLVLGGVILWLAERWGRRALGLERLGFGGAFGIGAAQAIALVPGVSRSGISISAGLFLGLEREAAARFSFLMAAPITAGAGLFELRKLVTGEAGVDIPLGPAAVGFAAAAVAGMLAIHYLLRYLRSHPTYVFVAYRVLLAAITVVVLLGR